MKRLAIVGAAFGAASVLFGDVTGHGGLTPNPKADRRQEQLRQEVRVQRYDVR